ncbi:MAG: HD domain-containing protein, partial [Treponema sp.]|nr:HD domain-containing protein [Treponema sp.]
LHDIGKIKISDAILNKPGKLTEEEFEVMKTHTTEGMKILSKTLLSTTGSGYLKESIDMAWCHHEWWNGKGYPRGLKGEDIPLSARIMAVADVFDALLSRRSYKEPIPFDRAIEIVKNESGTHFDPLVVAAFLNTADFLRDALEFILKDGR